LRESRIDSVFFLSGGITVFGTFLLLYCRLTRRRTAALIYGKDVLQARLGFLGSVLLRASTNLTDCVLANSKFTSSLVPFVPSRKIMILYPGVDPIVASQTPSSQEPPGKRILFVGRLVERKGVKDLIDAFRILSEEVLEAKLEVVGDGPQRSQLEKLAADLNLGNKVSFLGTLTGAPLYEKYSSCDVFVMPSVTFADDVEGFGTVFLEAGLFGKPSIGTFAGGIPEAVENNRTGLLVHEGNVQELARAMRRLLTDKDLARSLGQNARARVLEKFSWATSTKQLLRSFDEIE
jgi:glycosyltransferase involved in cell wall biosynthesis